MPILDNGMGVGARRPKAASRTSKPVIANTRGVKQYDFSQIKPPASANTPAPPAPLPNSGRSSGGGGGNYSGGPVATSLTGIAAAAPAPAPAPPTDDDWWGSDEAYISEGASLKNAMETALANLARQRASYDTDYTSTLKNLGWDWQGDDAGDLSNVAGGKWDPTNMLGVYGQGLNNMNNDFGSRGLMDSSFFGDAITNFNTDMNNQFNSANKARTSYMDEYGDKTGQGLAARNEYQNALARAKAESLARRDAKYGIV